jgi:restriction endonuclease
MNVNDVKQLKQHYETQLQTKLSALLGLQAESIHAEWSLEKTIITIKTNNQNTLVDYIFEYDGTNFVIRSSAYQVVAKNNVLIGVVASVATIDLNTIHAIFDTVVEVINSAINEDNCDAAEPCEG